jgi:hypothetical protein
MCLDCHPFKSNCAGCNVLTSSPSWPYGFEACGVGEDPNHFGTITALGTAEYRRCTPRHNASRRQCRPKLRCGEEECAKKKVGRGKRGKKKKGGGSGHTLYRKAGRKQVGAFGNITQGGANLANGGIDYIFRPAPDSQSGSRPCNKCYVQVLCRRTNSSLAKWKTRQMGLKYQSVGEQRIVGLLWVTVETISGEPLPF